MRRLARAYRTFRAFDRPNVVHWFSTFARSPSFAREFPEAVQGGPLWPGRFVRGLSGPRPEARVHGVRRILWYASPGSSERLAREIGRGLEGAAKSVHVEIRAAGVWRPPLVPGVTWRISRPLTDATWYQRFAGADLRIVTGSRTLLEAIELGGPFLYFNGVLGPGSSPRRHRPEKLDALLTCWSRPGVSARWRRDLAAFGRLRRVAPILRRAATDPRWTAGFPRWRGPIGFAPPYDDGRAFLRSLVERFDDGGSSTAVVAAARSGRLPASTARAFRRV